VLVHLVWATRWRRPLLPATFDATLGAILGEKSRDLGCILLAAGCASDHSHVVVRVAPGVALANLVQRLKGACAHDVNQRALLPHALHWQAGYWAESLGPADFDSLARYVRAQRDSHDDSHPAERWQERAEWEPALGGL
jgi:putative transposase